MNKVKLIKYRGEFLTLANYKEPLRPVENGYGYYGALLSTTDGERIQCHVCGGLYSSVGAHARQKHKLPAKEYKQKYMLAYNTALISENEREELKQRTINWQNSLTPKERLELKKKARKAAKKILASLSKQEKYALMSHPHQLETKNKRGTCPDQLLEKIKEATRYFKRTPSSKEFVEYCGTQRYKYLIFKVFGSWNNALHMLNMEPKKRDERGRDRFYTDEELLEYLANFAREHKKIPTATDFKRGVLPNFDTYTRHFGNIEEARQLAGVYTILGE